MGVPCNADYSQIRENVLFVLLLKKQFLNNPIEPVLLNSFDSTILVQQ